MSDFSPTAAIKAAAIYALVFGTVWLEAAAPVVSNVRASQRSGSKLVDIYYDLADSDSATVRVSLQTSSDGGTTWEVPAQTLVGTGVGDSVTPGNGRWIKWDAGVDWNGQASDKVRFRVIANDDPPIPAGMALIPAGAFQMGNSLSASGEGLPKELPVHRVTVSAFYMDQYVVSKQRWDDVRVWGLNNGYTDLPVGGGRAATHPVQSVSWYAVVKWCNARSQKENLVPVYYTNDAQTVVYKTGNVDLTNAQVKWGGNGYRLPTEAEWEKAARGGLAGKRFPWGDTISHSQANYNVYSLNGTTNYYSYDVSPTRGYHPTYMVNPPPYTSPVGSFAPNGYGLYDMAGNVWEWCWDGYDYYYYSTSPGTDPQGPPLNSSRVIRGGSYNELAIGCRTASRTATYQPGSINISDGFRSVRRLTGSGDSGNVRVDTTDWNGTITVSMHRATSNVLNNASNTAGVDEPLRVKATNRALLGTQPVLQGNSGSSVTGGLVADGVTPLIFRISTNSPTATGRTYEVRLSPRVPPLPSGGTYAGSLAGLLLVEGSNAFIPGSTVTLSSARPDAYVVVQPVLPENLSPNGAGQVELSLEVRDTASSLVTIRASYGFGLRRPPVALVHGYNVTNPAWGAAYTTALADRAGFVLPVGYGLTDDLNTTGSLWKLAGTLNGELLAQVEKAPALSNWTFTRYDAVGHSQGGVLLRMLCSQDSLVGGGTVSDFNFVPFRNKDNFFRGRFRRVVTIGSPHAGSTLAEMGYQLRWVQPVAPYPFLLASAIDFQSNLDYLFQPKFRIGQGAEVNEINGRLTCDSLARLHLVGTTIYGGNAPSGFSPQYYTALYLDRETPTVDGLRPGLVVAPRGSDGVVDLDSQKAGGGSNHTSVITGVDISHIADTDSSTVAQRANALLGGSASEFGPVSIPASLAADRSSQALQIASLALAIKNGQSSVSASCYAPNLAPQVAMAASLAIGAPSVASVADQTLQFTLHPPVGESVNGKVEWSAVVYGPTGVTATGLTLTPTGTYGEQLALTVAASVQGQVVLRVRFPSVSGVTVIGMPGVVLDRPPGNLLTGISLTPAQIQSQVGTEVPLAVSAIYDGSVPSSLFTNAANTTFQSSNPGVATVDAEGRVKLLALGTATITATYNGTAVATTAVTVLEVAPIVTSAASVSGTVGQVLSHQLTSSQAVQSFAAAPLPPGLTLNAQTGLISGTPTTQGASSGLVSVTNANGTGSKRVDFIITGPSGAPTDLGLNVGGVSEQKPIGTLVGRFATVDPNPLDTFTYQLVLGTGSTDNAKFTITGDQLFTAAVLNRATQSTVSIRVRTTDSTAAFFEKLIVLPVMSPPAIMRQPDPQRVFTGDRVVFSVSASGLEPLNYQWKKDGADVPGANNRILELASADATQAGGYSATVANGDGSAISAAASLTVDPISYDKWLSLVPNATGGPVYDPLGDYNHDGVANFLEFAFGVPQGAASGLGAQPFMSHDASGLLFTYYTANGIQPLTYRIMKSVDLGAWEEHLPAPSDVTSVNYGSYTQVKVRVAWAVPKMFLRLQVGTQ